MDANLMQIIAARDTACRPERLRPTSFTADLDHWRDSTLDKSRPDQGNLDKCQRVSGIQDKDTHHTRHQY